MRRALVFLAAVCSTTVGLAVVSPGRAMACSCIRTTPIQALGRTDASFTGKVIARRSSVLGPNSSSLDPVTLTFAVESVFKGTVRRRQQIVTVSSGASCGLEVEDGATYLVFGSKEASVVTPSPGRGQYGANLCNGTAAAPAGYRPEGFPSAKRPLAERADPVATPNRSRRPTSWMPRIVAGFGVVAVVAIAAAIGLRRRTPANRRGGP